MHSDLATCRAIRPALRLVVSDVPAVLPSVAARDGGSCLDRGIIGAVAGVA